MKAVNIGEVRLKSDISVSELLTTKTMSQSPLNFDGMVLREDTNCLGYLSTRLEMDSNTASGHHVLSLDLTFCMKPSPWWYSRSRSLFFSLSPCKGRMNISYWIFDRRRDQTNPHRPLKSTEQDLNMFLLRTQILTPFYQMHRLHLSSGITVSADWKNILVFTFKKR